MLKKPAIFVAGDERIFFPALVALDSIQDKNPDTFDAFMCFDASKLTSDMIEALKHHKITFIDAKTLEVDDRIATLPQMAEGRWPIEILLNWALPEYLLTMGYEQSIKVDYDILCLSKYEIQDVMPATGMARGLIMNISLEKEGLTADSIALATQQKLLNPQVRAYMNAGFIAFDNQLCHKNKFFDRLLKCYEFIFLHCPKAKLIEQLALYFAFSSCQDQVEELDSVYNHRVRWAVLVDKNLHPTAKNLHYITNVKPWAPFDRSIIRGFVDERQGVLFAYRSIWLDRASRSPWFSKFCNESETSQEKALGISILIAHNYNQRIVDLENKLKVERDKSAQSEALLNKIRDLLER
ncbi:glycosyltransferase [Pseudomonas fulva]|uniref:glycosyltransferase n=1 Tax=Pseudomonas fulva TaxID=47880 RepID=UPI002DBD99A0|nr:glycosyltransferase [Pseudomonas fulva]MEC4023475.1 glycosyltransferase [Pseudomonas fulva]